jgi:hypothetical protein
MIPRRRREVCLTQSSDRSALTASHYIAISRLTTLRDSGTSFTGCDEIVVVSLFDLLLDLGHRQNAGPKILGIFAADSARYRNFALTTARRFDSSNAAHALCTTTETRPDCCSGARDQAIDRRLRNRRHPERLLPHSLPYQNFHGVARVGRTR